MKKISAKLFASVSWIITVAVTGLPLAGHAAPEVVAWGGNSDGQTNAPGGLSNVVAIAAGASYSLALTAEGQVVAWGNNEFGQATVPSGLGNVVGIAAGWNHSLALTAGGRLMAWGYNGYGQTTVPTGLSNGVGIAAGSVHSLALTSKGRVVAWGYSGYGQTDVPGGLSNVVAIAAGGFQSLALTAEGRVVAWGRYHNGSTYVPMTVPSGLSNVVAIAAGQDHSLALTADGRVAGWGSNGSGETDVPSGLSNVVGIAAGGYYSLALTAEGRVVAWGWNLSGQTNVPSGLSNVVGIAAGRYHSLALSGLPPGVAAPARVGPRFLVTAVDQPFHYRIMVKNGADAYGAVGLPTGLALDPSTGLITGQPAQAGKHSLVLSATNSMGSCEWTVTLYINVPVVPGIGSSGVVMARLGSDFSYAVVAYNAPEWYGASGLPAGWIIDAQTGVISGVPVELGDFVVSLVASNRYGLGTGSLILRVSSVVAWGDNSRGQTDVPSGLTNVVAIAAGHTHSLALTDKGRVVAWGDNEYGQTTVPSGLSNVVAIAAAGNYSLALTSEGRVVSWGEATVPSDLSNVVAIAAGDTHYLALTAEGRVVAWGAATVPNDLSNVVAIAAGGNYGLALTAKGRVVGWGAATVPNDLSNVVAIAAGWFHTLVLTADGRVVSWRASDPTTVSSGPSNVVAIAAGYAHSLALIGLSPGMAAPAWAGPRFLVATVDQPFHHRIMVKNGVTAYGAAGLPPGLALDPNTGLITGQPTEAGKYSMVLSATNSMGSCEWTMTLNVNGRHMTPAIASSGVVLARLGCGFSFAVVAYYAPEWYGASGLPAGLSIDAQTGVISGVPVEVGDFVVSLVASNRYGLGTGSLTLRVSSSPIVEWSDWYSGQTTGPSGLSNVVAIAAGFSYSLALTAEGKVVAWGDNSEGQTDVPRGLSNVVAIAAGLYHSLALTANGGVVAWGNTTVPSGLSNVVAIAAGANHSLALTAEGQVVNWGGYMNYDTYTYVPMTVPSGLSNVVAIAAGNDFSLALTAEGRVVGWGGDNYGQSSGIGLSNVVAIAAGGYHSVALTSEGQVVEWGFYANGQTIMPSGLSNVVAIAAGGGMSPVGTGGQSLALTADGWVVGWGGYQDPNRGRPIPIAPVPSDLSNVVAIAAGGHHSLALIGLPPGMAAPAWVGPRFLMATVDQPFHHRIMALNGVTAYGAAGLPTGLALDLNAGLITGLPVQAGTYSVVLSATNSVGSSAWTVTLFVNGLHLIPAIASSGVVQVGLGSAFSFAVVADNAPEWYGANGLPAGLVIDAQTGVISGVPVEMGDFVVSLVASNRYGLGTGSLTLSTSSLSPVVAWGYNAYSQTTLPSGLSNVVAVAAGDYHSLALTAQGQVLGWGDNSSGQTTVPSGLSNVVAVAAGYQHSLALTAEGRVVAWGATTVPSDLSNVVAIAAGYSHSLALTAQGRVVAWGNNGSGQTTVPCGLSNVVAIAAGDYHSLALTAEGQVVAWGLNSSRQTDVPSGLSNIVGISAGWNHSMALTSQGRVVAWGSGSATTVPSGLSNVVVIAAGTFHSLALTAQGRVVAWGNNSWGQTNVPVWLTNVVGIAAGASHSLALLRQPMVPTPRLELSLGVSGLELQAQGAPGISCLLLRASRLPGPWLPAEPVTFTNSFQLLRPPDTSEPAQFFRLLRK